MKLHDRRWAHCALAALLALTLGGTMRAATAAELTLERLFAAPELSGEGLRSPQFSPDGRLLAYLKGSAGDRDRLDLWAYDIATQRHRLLVDARALAPQPQPLAPEEAARRERQRTSAMSGILEYQFSPDAHTILVPLGGALYLYDLAAPAASAVRRINAAPGQETDAKFSPRGHYLSYVRDRNLYVYELATARESRVTPDCREPVSCGVAEFVAQEEMERYTGYWWAPDESALAWTRVDESRVPQVQRFEIYADRTQVVPQRYPAAGTHNAEVSLFVSRIARTTASASASTSGAPAPAPAPDAVEIGLGATDFYLARVDWFPDSRDLAVQRQSRDQKTLELLAADSVTGESRVLLREHSDSWVDLNDELTFLPASSTFLWVSSRSGYRHLYQYDFDGHLLRTLTSGEWMVIGDRRGRAIRGVDERRGLVYFLANRDSTIERQLYVASLRNPRTPLRRLTEGAGWHAVQMAPGARIWLDRYSNVRRPPSVTLRGASGRTLAELVPNRLVAGHPYAPYLDTAPVVSFGTLTAEDGQLLNYQLTVPPQLEPGRRYPVIVEVYGGPGVQNVSDSWGESAHFFDHLLGEHGYVVFSLDNRGSGMRGTRFESALYHQLGRVEVRDQLRGVEFLKTLPYVDPARIGVFGWSYGGYMTLMCLMQAPGVFAAGVAGAPVTDWRLYDTHYTERYLGTPESDPRGYEDAGVLPYAARLSSPLLLMHGMADDNVLFANSTLLIKRLQDLRKPFELMVYPGAKHSLLRHADEGPHAYETILRFFDRTLADRPIKGT